ncbi:hypothetical protein [Streptomyces venezuelae]|uniref:hypothetical protein n=1 Tax=Streptomyces venezuelae TaxID=54571 RepID=UPI00365411B2
MAQVADHEAQMEHDLIATYDEHELDFTSDPVPHPAHRPPPPHRTPTSRRRSRGR